MIWGQPREDVDVLRIEVCGPEPQEPQTITVQVIVQDED